MLSEILSNFLSVAVLDSLNYIALIGVRNFNITYYLKRQTCIGKYNGISSTVLNVLLCMTRLLIRTELSYSSIWKSKNEYEWCIIIYIDCCTVVCVLQSCNANVGKNFYNTKSNLYYRSILTTN